MKTLLRSKYVWYISLIAFLLSLFVVFTTTLFPYHLTLELQSESDGALQVFYSTQVGFSESNSRRTAVQADDNYHTYSIKLDHQNIKYLRIDPTGNFKIKSIAFNNVFNAYKYEGEDLYKKIKPLHDIQSLTIRGKDIVVKTNGTDPYLEIKDLPPIKNQNFLLHITFLFVVFVLIFAALIVLWNYYLRFDYITTKENNNNINLSNNVFLVLIVTIFAWFAFQTLFLAFNISKNIGPDESYHYELSIQHSKSNTLFVKDTQETYYLGAVSVRPYFYHLIMGKLLLLNVIGLSDLIFLRLINVALSILSLYLTFLLTKEITKNRWIQLTVLVVQTNILMYVFISSMISYDNLINLISVGSFLILIRFLNDFSRHNLMLLLVLMMVGTLTKISYAPIVVIQLLILVAYSPKILKNNQKIFKAKFTTNDYTLLGLILVLFGLNLHLFGNNIINYGQLQPKTAKVIGHDIAYKYYAQYKRDYDLKASVSERAKISFNSFVIKYLGRIETTTFGIMGHKNMFKKWHEMYFYNVLLFIAFLFSLFNYKTIWKTTALRVLLFSFITYSIVLFLVNYNTYSLMELFGLALQGRYNFPVLAITIIFLMFNLMDNFGNRTKSLILLTITILFVYNGFFWFLSHSTPDWFFY